MVLLSVDPGVRECGCAIFWNSQLVRAELVVNPVKRGQDVASAFAMAEAVNRWYLDNQPERMPVMTDQRLVIECPTVRKAGDQKGDQNTSIVPLTLVVGAVAGRIGLTCSQFFPRDWKGTLNGDVFIRERIIPAVSSAERPRVFLPTESLAHNVWDGVGVGLKALGRLEPRRVYHKES